MNANLALVRFLVQSGFLATQPDEQLYSNPLHGALAALEQHKILVQHNALQHLSKSLGLSQVSLEQAQEQSNWKAEYFIGVLGNEFCWQHKVLPFQETQEQILVACCNPFQDDTRRLLEFYLQKAITFVLTDEDGLKKALHKWAAQDQTQKTESQLAGANAVLDVQDKEQTEQDSVNSASTPVVIQLCNRIISEAIERKASDIHVEPSDSGLDVRIRVLGSMTRVLSITKDMQSYVLTRLKIMSRMDISERRKPQDGRMRVKSSSQVIDIRVSSIPTAYGEKIVMRLLSGAAVNKDLAKLGIPEHINNELLTSLGTHGRMLLVTGPTGSGKSTTLYACLQNIINKDLNIVTVEDPIEYRIRGINQIQVDEAAGVTFASALRSILRQDPDVIMIGEIRDLETATIAIQAAQTGHLVLSTLHTNDAPSAIRRLEQLGVPNYQIASAVSGVLAQRLVRTLCPKCARAMSSDEISKAKHTLAKHGITELNGEFRVPTGCPDCYHSGYSGRIGVYSYLKMDERLEQLVCEQASVPEMTKLGRTNGYTSLRESAVALLTSGRTSLYEVLPIIISNSEKIEPNQQLSTPTISPAAVAEKNNKPSIDKTRIMIVEDDSGLRQVLTMLLQKEMFEVVQAENGLDALEKVYHEQPQLILCDLMMPGMDGRELLKRVKSNPQTSKIPVVMLTAADDESNEVDLLDLGASDFISKASSSGLMLTRIRRAVSNLE